MEDITVKNLLTISAPRDFKQGSYICHEGELGSELFIIVKGKVGIYINDMLDEGVEAAVMQPGELFGEMALVDRMPRSASCVALEDTVCIAVERSNLRRLITTCPEIAENLLLSLSTRLRDMNDRLYKSQSVGTKHQSVTFAIPAEHRGHHYCELRGGGGRLLDPFHTTCPICNKHITVYHVRQFDLKLKKILPNQRRIYDGLDVLWHFIWNCPECGYANFHVDFFHLDPMMRSDYLRAVTEQTRVLKMHNADNTSPFDAQAFLYYRAIHFNECFNSANILLLGKLWLYLSWLYGDAGDPVMQGECREHALKYYIDAYEDRERTLPTENARQQCAMMLAEMYFEKGDLQEARRFYLEVVGYPGPRLTQTAYDRIYDLRQRHVE